MDHLDNFKKLEISRYATDKYYSVVNASRGLNQKGLQNLLYKSIGIMVVTLQKVDNILHNMLRMQKQLSEVTGEVDMQFVLNEYKRNRDNLINKYIDKPNVPNKSMTKYIDSVVEQDLITSDQGEILHTYRKLRNKYVHTEFVLEPRKLISNDHIKAAIKDVTAIAIVLGDFTETLTYKNMETMFGSKEAVTFFKGVAEDAIEKIKS
jgi:hypothetical protein